MQSAKKSTKILSALSMAAAATIAAKAAHGATLTMYYGQDSSYANSNNNIEVSTSAPNFASKGVTKDTKGETEYFTSPTLVSVSQTAPTTITIPVGAYLSIALDAVLTGNPEPDAGEQNSANATYPAVDGLSELSTTVSSTDATGSILTPISKSTTPFGSAGGQNTYLGTATINTSFGSNGTNSNVPVWNAVNSAADVQPNEAGFDPGHGSGNVGINGYNSGGNTGTNSSTAAGLAVVGAFGASSASYTNATDFADGQIFQGLTAGTVTLTPLVQTSGTQYWVDATPNTSGPSQYKTKTFGSGDVINQLPPLVIVVGNATTAPTAHAIVSLAATASANSNYGSTLGSLTITGSGSAGYTTAQLTGLSSSKGNVNTSAWASTSDKEIYGVDVEVGGQQATAAQLATLLNAINGGDGTPASSGVTASLTDPSGGQALSKLDTSSTTYNLFLSFAGGPSIPLDNLGLDLSSANDPALSGYTFTAVSVVPEPVSLGLLALGGVGLMSRRSRRKA